MAHVLACKRVKAAKVWKQIPLKYIEALEQNQKIASCCRHPENHDIEAFYSNEDERWRGKDPARDIPNPPDIYKFHCTCGRVHTRFCVGGNHGDAVKYTPQERPELFDNRPFWEVR
mgnify:CR=1 FL=1